MTQGAGRTFYLWGAQVEVGSFATSYIATTTAAVTRAADVVTLATSSITGFSATAGTLYAEGAPHYASGAFATFPALAGFDDATANERIFIRRNDGAAATSSFNVVDGGAAQATITGTASNWTAANDIHKIAGAWAANNFQAADDGTLGTADVSGTLPTVTTFRIGTITGGNILNGYLRRVAYWNTRLANATLQSLTT